MTLTPHIAQALRDSGKRIVVSGSGGWLGMATLELLSQALGDAFEQRVACFGSSAKTLSLLDGRLVDQRPLAEIANLPPMPTIVLHLAFLTKDRAEAMDEQDYRAANLALDRTTLDSLGPIGAEAIFVASSGAAIRADDSAAAPAMRLYGSLKRDQETRFADWAEREGKRAVIARIFNISGPHINKHGSYALACFILDALAGRPITIKASHRVVRGYVAIRELMSLVFALLLDKRSTVTRFDSGGEPMEMQAIAQVVANRLGPVPIERPRMEGTTDDHYTGEHARYCELLAQNGVAPVPFERQVLETADFLREN